MKSSLTWGGLSNKELVGVIQLHLTRTNRSYLWFCQGLDSKYDNLDKITLLILSIFLSLVGFGLRLSYILYQYISSFCKPNISYRFSQVCQRTGVLSLKVKHDIFRHGGEETWQKHLKWYSQHNIVDPCTSIMSNKFCRWKKSSWWKSINTHTNFDKLCETCDTFNLTILIKPETFYTKNLKSLIDFVFTNNPFSFQKTHITETELSDYHKFISTFFKL